MIPRKMRRILLAMSVLCALAAHADERDFMDAYEILPLRVCDYGKETSVSSFDDKVSFVRDGRVFVGPGRGYDNRVQTLGLFLREDAGSQHAQCGKKQYFFHFLTTVSTVSSYEGIISIRTFRIPLIMS